MDQFQLGLEIDPATIALLYSMTPIQSRSTIWACRPFREAEQVIGQFQENFTLQVMEYPTK